MKKQILPITLLAACAVTSHAASVATETFTYADTADIGALNGGSGWSSAWSHSSGGTTSKWTIANNQAIYQGNGSGGTVDYSRTLTSSIQVTTLTTVTLSLDVLIGNGAGDVNAGRAVGVTLTSGGGDVIFLGKGINQGIGAFTNLGGATQHGTTTGASAGTTYSISAEFSYDGADTTLKYTQGANTFTEVFSGQQLSFDAVQLSGYHGSTTSNGVDSIDIDVSAVPEPSSIALLGLGGLSLILRRRR